MVIMHMDPRTGKMDRWTSDCPEDHENIHDPDGIIGGGYQCLPCGEWVKYFSYWDAWFSRMPYIIQEVPW